MKADWRLESLGHVCELISGQHIEAKDYNESGRGVPYLTGPSDFGDRSPLITKWTEFPKRMASPGDILITVKGSGVGKINYLDQEVAISRQLMAIRPHGINTEFLYAFLSTHFDHFQSRSTGTAIPGIAREDVLSLQCPVPPPSEQQRIMVTINEAFEGIATAKANAEKNLQSAREVFELYLRSALLDRKWEWKTIGDVAASVEYGSAAKSKKAGNIPVLRMGNIQNGQLDWSDLVYTDDEAEVSQYLLKQDDVLFNRTNSPELVGKSAIYKSEMPAVFAGYLIRINRREDLLDGEYLTYFLNSRIALEYGKTVMISSVNQANINGSKLKSYPIPVPNLKEQKNIANSLKAIQDEATRLESIYQQKLSALNELKQSFLQRAFNGEL